MCTAISLKCDDGSRFFGRNMDLEYEFGQSVIVIPRNFDLINRVTNENSSNKYAIMGMGTVIENYPLLADGCNEHGLACAGLNFPGLASYDAEITENKINIAPYDMILWILSNFKTVDEVLAVIDDIRLINKPFSTNLPLPTLHWIIYDKYGRSIVIEKMVEKFSVFENKLGILSNSPSFDWHLTNLNQYAGLSANNPTSTSWNSQEIKPQGQGLGLRGLPGDSYPASRFVRSAFMCTNAKFTQTKESTLATFFHILDNLAFVDGTVTTDEGHTDITLYSSAIDLEHGIYYYKTYKNSQINAVNMNNEDLNSTELKVFEYKNEQQINQQN